MNILLHGCNGRMGQVLTRIIAETDGMDVVCGVDSFKTDKNVSYPVYSSLKEVSEKCDVVIDFSNHSCISDLLAFGVSTHCPLVICTTGFDENEKEEIKKASLSIPVLTSGNMSLGINLLMSLVKQAAKLLYGDFDIEVIEKHHNQKLDSPSGTALMLADAAKEGAGCSMEYKYGRHSKCDKRPQAEIGIHSIRGGAIVGEHDVIFAGAGEVIELSHTALSRDVFAYGAIKAAAFLCNKEPGLFSMDDVISESSSQI